VEAAGGGWVPDQGALHERLSSADFVVTVLPGSPELRAVMLGTAAGGDGVDVGVLRSLGPQALWIDLTSAAPDVARDLEDAAARHGARYVDAAIGGGPAEAQAGHLTLYVGGGADDVAAARTVLSHLAKPDGIRHMGPPGTGYLTKLLINQLWFGQSVAVAEAVALATASGVDAPPFSDALRGGPADSAFVRDYLPRLLAGDAVPAFGLGRVVEELESLRRSASAAGVPWSTSGAVADVHRAALQRLGDVDGELLAAVDILRQAPAGQDAPRT
jgi:3-hydroxyisobutyrate dehydrogenase-like beta-hydroxyacid dehydrogenase